MQGLHCPTGQRDPTSIFSSETKLVAHNTLLSTQITDYRDGANVEGRFPGVGIRSDARPRGPDFVRVKLQEISALSR